MNKGKLHIGTKLILALAMTRLEYNNYRGWELPENETHLANEAGSLVEYVDGGKSNHPDHKGYISWSPKEVFDNAYQDANKGVSFGSAVMLAKLGYKVARKGWNGAGMFVYIVPANSYPAQTEMIKGIFGNDLVPYREYWALKTAQNDIAMWAPSGSDSLADDWVIADSIKPETFADRLKIEQSELCEKLAKLTAFISDEKFMGLSASDQLLLSHQSDYMLAYLGVLERRISLI